MQLAIWAMSESRDPRPWCKTTGINRQAGSATAGRLPAPGVETNGEDPTLRRTAQAWDKSNREVAQAHGHMDPQQNGPNILSQGGSC